MNHHILLFDQGEVHEDKVDPPVGIMDESPLVCLVERSKHSLNIS